MIERLRQIKKSIGRKIIDNQFSGLTIREVFTKVYEEKYWDDHKNGLEYSSGTGSCEKLSRDYCKFVSDFVQEKNINSIVDLGCGDFQVSRQILDYCDVTYTGYDCVPKLINYNQEKFADERTSFLYANIVEDELINADICLIRQVLQHLSNEQIISILEKTKQYKYLIVTEHYPLNSEFTPNLDHQPGPRTRLYKNSAVVLDKAPFLVTNLNEVLSIREDEYIGGYIKTFVIEN